MHDLRVRFGAILALSLLPLLLMAIVQSFYDYRSDGEDRRAVLESAALTAAAEVVGTLDNAMVVLRVTGETVDTGSDCNAQLTNILNAVSHLDYLGIVDPSGEYICRASNVRNSEIPFALDRLPNIENPFQIETRASVRNVDPADTTVVTMYGVFDGAILSHIVLGSFKIESLNALQNTSLLEDDARVAIINRRGEVLLGGLSQNAATRSQWIAVVAEQGRYQGQITEDDNQLRDLIVVESGSDDIYVAMSTPSNSLLSWSVINPLSSLLIPILAWLFGFAAIWLAADQLILVHLRKLQRRTISFAAGNLDERVGKLRNPPQAIYTLGKNFDIMADRISEREAAIIDSLDEKETLLREIHHRVKNNLQIIISLLNMQERKLPDESERDAIIETRSRINAIALVHRGLYESQDLRYVNIKSFLERLMTELSVAFGMAEKKIHTNIDVDCAPMEADVATPVALFIVEALTNSVKHGVSGGGHIDINILQKGDNISVRVSDDGPTADLTSTTSGTGTKLMRGFARQLGGSVEVESEGAGYAVTLKFDLRDN